MTHAPRTRRRKAPSDPSSTGPAAGPVPRRDLTKQATLNDVSSAIAALHADVRAIGDALSALLTVLTPGPRLKVMGR